MTGRPVEQIIHVDTPNSTSVHYSNAISRWDQRALGSIVARTAQVGVVHQSGAIRSGIGLTTGELQRVRFDPLPTFKWAAASFSFYQKLISQWLCWSRNESYFLGIDKASRFTDRWAFDRVTPVRCVPFHSPNRSDSIRTGHRTKGSWLVCFFLQHSTVGSTAAVLQQALRLTVGHADQSFLGCGSPGYEHWSEFRLDNHKELQRPFSGRPGWRGRLPVRKTVNVWAESALRGCLHWTTGSHPQSPPLPSPFRDNREPWVRTLKWIPHNIWF